MIEFLQLARENAMPQKACPSAILCQQNLNAGYRCQMGGSQTLPPAHPFTDFQASIRMIYKSLTCLLE